MLLIKTLRIIQISFEKSRLNIGSKLVISYFQYSYFRVILD